MDEYKRLYTEVWVVPLWPWDAATEAVCSPPLELEPEPLACAVTRVVRKKRA